MMYEELVKRLELVKQLREHQCDATEDDTQEFCEECAYDVIIADKSVPSGFASVCVCGLMRRAADAIEELQTTVDGLKAQTNMVFEETEGRTVIKFEPKWIPVTERLPEEDGRYLTLYPLKTKPSVWRHKVYGFAKDLAEVDEYEFNEHKSGFYGYDGEYGYYEDTDVAYWMPLPEPPKDGEL